MDPAILTGWPMASPGASAPGRARRNRWTGCSTRARGVGDQGILNWSAVRGSNTDFNANSRATPEGCGFASALAGEDPPDPCTNNLISLRLSTPPSTTTGSPRGLAKPSTC